MLYFFEGYAFTEIAEKLNQSLETSELDDRFQG